MKNDSIKKVYSIAKVAGSLWKKTKGGTINPAGSQITHY
jgi:hypothetical protein